MIVRKQNELQTVVQRCSERADATAECYKR